MRAHGQDEPDFIRNLHVPCPIISDVATKKKKPEEFLDETPENGNEQVEYLDDEFEEDELEDGD